MLILLTTLKGTFTSIGC